MEPRSQICLPLKDPSNKIIGMITIEASNVIYKCYPMVDNYSRDFKLHADSESRCHGHGSCVNDFCSKLKPQDKVSELDGIANDHFGYSYCDESCGSIFCGCPPWSGFSCLLYRVYALPTTDNRIFEIFHCIFEASLKFNLTYEDFTEKNNSFSHEFFLSPNKPFTYNNIKLNFGSPTKPDSTPSYFATDGKKFVMLSREDFDASKHLKCPSKKDAFNFNCTFMESIIRCNPAGNSENCHFDDQSIKEIFDNEKNQLPIETPFEVIYGDKEGVHYEPIRSSGINLYLQLKWMKIASTITKTSCQVEPLGLTGIRKTQVGVKFSYKCKAIGKVAATISCEDSLSFEVICDETGKSRTKQLPIVNQKNSLTCSTLCSGSTTFFTLDMKTVEEFEDDEVYPISTYEQARKHMNKIWSNFTKIDVYGVLLWFFDDAIRIMVLVMVIMVSFLIPLPYLLPYLGCCCECLKQCCLPRRVTKSSEKKEI
uniref:Phlebovirus glycoprotein G2 fusion domain-containing protein n=1 Tax=Acrobeloides nanus TaxID=290746 RepID=A0A914EF28_9BILA